MLIFLLSLALFLFFFGSQFLTLLFISLSGAKKLGPGLWDLPLVAQKRRVPTVYIMEDPPLEVIVMANAWSFEILVSRNLWERWNVAEKSAILYWCVSARLFSTNFGRWLWGFQIAVADRNASLESSDKFAVVGALEKAALERTQTKPGILTGLFSGLSLIGPSLLFDWPSVADRLKDLTFHLSKLEKAR